MNADLSKQLKETYQLSDEQIEGIGKLGVNASDDMALVEVTDLTALEVPVITARKIVAAYKPKDEAQPAASAQPAGPQKIDVTVNQPKALGEMGVGELLAFLAGDPTNDDAFGELTGRLQYKDAAGKTEKVAVVTEAGALDAKATTTYWQYLKKGSAQRRFNGQRTVTLEKALGRVEKLLHHPLMAGETIYMGMDGYGCDWKVVDRERMEAAYWARTTKHKLFPANVDALTAYEELKAATLNTRWAAIVEDYKTAVEEQEVRVSLVVAEGQADPAKPFRLADTRLEV